MERPDRVIAFIENLTITSGPFAGQNFRLRDWQKEIIRAIYGPTDERGRRRVRTALLTMARKNGKTQLAAALVLAHLIGPEAEQRGQIYSAAADRAQASLIFQEAAAMIRADPELESRVNIVESVKRIVHYSSGSFYQAVSSESRRAHGFGASVIIYDELARAPNRRLWDVLTSSTGGREEPLTVAISTQSSDPHSVMSELVDYAEREGKDDPTFAAFIYTLPKDADPWDEANWHKANPALGDFRSLEEMRDAARMAQRISAREAAFRNLYLNQRVDPGQQNFISAADWEACGATFDAESLRGKPCYGGLDLGSTQDLTALTLYFPSDGGKVLPYFWLPAERLQQREDKDRVPYSVWKSKGLLETTDGKAIDKMAVARKLAGLSSMFQIKGIAYDRWRIEDLLKMLSDDGIELPLKPFGQGFGKDMPPAIDTLETAILNRKLEHPQHPILTWNMSNVAILLDPTGARKFTKEKSRQRIDGVVALAMAVGLASRDAVKKPLSLNLDRPIVLSF